jgi:long-chain acyl-CoA synthetase
MAVSKCPIVENSCLCASPSAEYTVILICPNPKQIAVRKMNLFFIENFFFLLFQSYSEKHFGETQWQKLVDDEEFKEQVLKDIQTACAKNGIEKFETPQRVKIVTESWTPETGLVTDALKLKRKAIEQKYKDDIEDLYIDKPKSSSSKRPKKIRIETKDNPTDVSSKKDE